MDKESIYELQKVDCNCNNCGHLVRNIQKHKESVEQHRGWAWDIFNSKKRNLEIKAKEWDQRGEPEKAKVLRQEARTMKFQFSKKEVSIQYGDCTKLEKAVTFIPNTCQLETQQCFEHRKDITT